MLEILPCAAKRRCWPLPIGAALVVATLAGAGGCRHSESADQRLALRGEHIACTLDLSARNERSRWPPDTLNAIRRRARWHSEASATNVDELKRYWQRDWQRWIERQHEYGDEVRRILRGSPELIEGKAIILFF